MKNIFLVVFSMTSGLMASAQTIPGVIETQLDALINREGYRTYDDTVTLNAVRDYIVDEFSTHADVTYRQDYLVNGVTYSNVIALVGDTTLPRIIVGAHYDVCENQHGADDNGTGVVGLFQALEQLKDYSSEDYCIEFVAYTLEEPPFFRTTKMGSYIHAKSLHARGIEVHGMLSLEMIGYFSTEKKSQHYPIGILKLFYGGKGDYITVVRKMNKGKFARKFSRKYKHSKIIKTKKFTAPQSLPGIDFSDHLNYWALG
ncbi:MAG: M28 family peptidase, partial [Crocinitomicaceae bacterium]|nr:M28 family peptidase [Crocinitomicaceae bacterium]